ncbi:MAG: 30S ribosomal protein S24e [Thermoplasmata archaeon]|nr:MAG: 30S ribosomal protein S24e [Thermoplasmata archaeon]
MEVEIITKKENPVIGRLEVNFKVTHPKEITPRRKDIRDEIATLLKVNKDRIVIDNMKPEFGKPETFGYAKVYKKKDDALQMETKAVLKRNKLLEEKKEGGEKKGKAEEKKEKKEGA